MNFLTNLKSYCKKISEEIISLINIFYFKDYYIYLSLLSRVVVVIYKGYIVYLFSAEALLDHTSSILNLSRNQFFVFLYSLLSVFL